MTDDYYQILGVARSATSQEIQKAYRKLARKYHPDLHADSDEKQREEAKQKFQKVQQAYDVLSEPEKRQMYDQFGENFDQVRAGGYQGPFGGAGEPFSGYPGGGYTTQTDAASFDEFLRQMGMGGEPGGGSRSGGRGFEEILRQMGGFGRRSAGPSSQTSGQPSRKGEDREAEITIPFAISVLGGSHQVQFQRASGKVDTLEVKIPAGIEPDQKIRLRGQGQPSPSGGPPGDLLVKVKIAPHPVYSRSGLNLNLMLPISIAEAVLGAKVSLRTPHGNLTLTVPPASSGGKQLRLKGMGIRTKDKSGDLIATLQIVIPKTVSDSDKELLNQLSGDWKTANRDACQW